jgi:hypothetical protein
MTDPFSSNGAKTPPNPFTVEEGHRKVRSFVLRRAVMTCAAGQRVATRRSNPLAGCHPQQSGDHPSGRGPRPLRR